MISPRDVSYSSKDISEHDLNEEMIRVSQIIKDYRMDDIKVVDESIENSQKTVNFNANKLFTESMDQKVLQNEVDE